MVGLVSYCGLAVLLINRGILHSGAKIVLDYRGRCGYTLTMLNRTSGTEPMTQFYFRHGAALSGMDNARVGLALRYALNGVRGSRKLFVGQDHGPGYLTS